MYVSLSLSLSLRQGYSPYPPARRPRHGGPSALTKVGVRLTDSLSVHACVRGCVCVRACVWYASVSARQVLDMCDQTRLALVVYGWLNVAQTITAGGGGVDSSSQYSCGKGLHTQRAAHFCQSSLCQIRGLQMRSRERPPLHCCAPIHQAQDASFPICFVDSTKPAGRDSGKDCGTCAAAP